MTITVTNGTLTKISETISPSSGYVWPSDVTVSGANKTYDPDAGTLDLDVTGTSIGVTAEAPATPSLRLNLLKQSPFSGCKRGETYTVYVKAAGVGYEDSNDVTKTWTKSN